MLGLSPPSDLKTKCAATAEATRLLTSRCKTIRRESGDVSNWACNAAATVGEKQTPPIRPWSAAADAAPRPLTTHRSRGARDDKWRNRPSSKRNNNEKAMWCSVEPN